MPICWGTPDSEVIAAAKKEIPANQWRRLDALRSRLEDVKATKEHLLTL